MPRYGETPRSDSSSLTAEFTAVDKSSSLTNDEVECSDEVVFGGNGFKGGFRLLNLGC
jgi:hypothetical protein